MTEDEKAEDYVFKHGFKYDYDNITSYEANKAIKQAYLAGYRDAPYPMA